MHPEPLTEPDVTLASYPARATQFLSKRVGSSCSPVDQTDSDAGGPPPLLHRHYPASPLLRGGPPLKRRFGTFGLAGPPLGPFPFASPLRFSSSARKPGGESRPLYTGHRRTKKKVAVLLVPGQCNDPGFDVVRMVLRCVCRGSFSLVSLPLT